MGGTRVLRARASADLPALEEIARDQPFPVASLHVDGATRTLTLPFERKHPRRESWELVVRGARSLTVEGHRQQTSDYLRSLRHDARTGEVVIEGVLILARLRVDGLDAEVRCLTPEEESRFDVADLPASIRREIEVQGTDQVRAHERYGKAERERERVLTVTGALAAVALGGAMGNPWWALGIDLAIGAGAALWLALGRRSFFGIGAAAYAAPLVLVSFSGDLVREMFRGGGYTGLGVSFLWTLHAGTGALLAVLNGRMMARNEGMESMGDVETMGGELPPADPRLPLRAALVCGIGAAGFLGFFFAPWLVCLVVAPLASGGTAWLLARNRSTAATAGPAMGGVGILLAAMAVLGGETLALAGVFVAVAHWVAGMMIAFHSRGEGPKQR